MIRWLTLATTWVLLTAPAQAQQTVRLDDDPSAPRVPYASRMLSDALTERGYSVANGAEAQDFTITLSLTPADLGSEAFTIVPAAASLAIHGGDERGLIYGSMSVVESLRNGVTLSDIEGRSESPHLEFRAIKHNLPWDSYRPSSAIDQHAETMKDLAYWEAFLDMMVENRFNVLSLWQLQSFSYMIRPTNFPEATPYSDGELSAWQDLYRGIFAMAKERGIDTYLVNWSIFVSQAFAEAHDVGLNNYYPSYYSDGDTTEVVRRYVRESVTQVLEEYPDLSGFGVSHGEGMGGMTPHQRQEWIDATYIEGMRRANRTSKLIHRVPFSANLSSAGSTSTDTERITRDAMERLEGESFIDGPIWVEMKFNWSHPQSTPELVKVHGGPLGDTYFVPEPTNYKVAWMIRNEDFFALRWGVPTFVREHIANNGSQGYVGGYFLGSETYLPALDYFTALEGPVDWRYAFERQWLYYKLWGRLLYDPGTPDDVFRADFVRRYGERASGLLDAYALASATPLRLASLYDATWDFTLYSEGFLSLQGQQTTFISVDRLINRPTMAPNYVSVSDYVARIGRGEAFSTEEVTPPILASDLERDARAALALVAEIDVADDQSLMYEVSDVRTWAYLALYLAEKLRGAVELETFRSAGDEARRAAAVAHLQTALDRWDSVIGLTRPLYRDMPLTHYNGNYFHANDDNLFHWALLRADVARDIEIARTSTPRAGEP